MAAFGIVIKFRLIRCGKFLSHVCGFSGIRLAGRFIFNYRDIHSVIDSISGLGLSCGQAVSVPM